MRTLCTLACAVLIVLYACNPDQQTTRSAHGPKVVEAHGYVVPADSMAAPKVIPVDESKLTKIPAGKPKVVPTNTNVHVAGTPKVVVAGPPRVCTPGQDTFLLPKTVPAIDSPFVAGIPEVVIAKDPAVKDQNPQNFSSFGKLQGLKHGYIHNIIQDRNGNLWFGTEGGVSRYDGKTFTHFTTAEGLSNDHVYSILEDRNGNLWFGTHGGGVSRYDGNTFTHFTTNEGLCNNFVMSILEDRNGNLWFGTNGGGVSRYDGNTFTHFTTAEGISNNTIYCILEDRNGNLWFGTNGGGVSRYEPPKDGHAASFTHFTTAEGLSNNTVESILEDSAGNLWFGTNSGGVSRYEPPKDGHAGTFAHFTTAEGLSDDIVFSIQEDRNGNLWFGTYGGGVSRYDDNTFTHFTTNEGLSNDFVFSILEDRNGNLWFGTNGGGVSRYDGNTFTHFTTNEGLSNNTVYSILEDRNGNLWFGTLGGGVSRYEPPKDGHAASFTHFTTAEGISNNTVYSILEDRNGNLWFGTNGGGVSRYEPPKDGHAASFTHFTTAEGLSNNFVMSILEDRSGNLWFGTRGGGVCRYEPPKDGHVGTITHFTTTEGLSNDFVFSILEDLYGNLWFGTRDGLNELTAKKLLEITDKIKSNSVTASDIFFTNYTYEDGFLGIGCKSNALYEDLDGTIWIGANDRLTAYHPPAENETPDTIRPNIQMNAVMLYNESVPWALLEQHQDTTLTMGNGLQVKEFQFDSISRWYGLPEQLSLAYNNNTITFGFIGITTHQPKKVKYQYKLEGNDENWSELSLRNEAPYGNLPHGSYTFKVKAMDSAGNWSDEFHYPFTIRPPWWLTWWAHTLYALGLITLLWQLHKYQQARTIRIERERSQAKELEQAKEIEKAYAELKATQKQLIQSEKMASLGEMTAGIAHEIQNPLNFVNNFSEVNSELIEELQEEAQKGNIGEVISIAKNLSDNEQKIVFHGKRADAIVKSMLQHSRGSSGQKEPTDINALCDEYLRLAYHGLRARDKSFNTSFRTDLDPTLPKIEVVPQDIGRVLLNLINNAFQACNAKQSSLASSQQPDASSSYNPEVTVTTRRLDDKIEIRVADNGNGIPDDIVDKIFQPFFTTKLTGHGTGLGLSMSYDIVKAHGGELKVESQEGKGSVFSLIFRSSS